MTQSAVAETKPASLWTRILAVLYVFDDALSTNELEARVGTGGAFRLLNLRDVLQA